MGIFEPKAGSWSKGPSLDGQRLYPASGVLGSSLVVVGGKIANVRPLTSTDVLDDVSKDWREGASVDIHAPVQSSSRSDQVGGFCSEA